ncbi:MAG: HAD-IA family hydrolase [Pseudomonadales bacterium]|nr:HAD-IA family hydrolase [Pseudomonadales bacterium]
MISGIFFDLGGTLFHYEGANKAIGSALVKAMMGLGAGSPKDVGLAYGQANKEVSVEFAQRDYYLHADMFRDTFLRATKALSIPFDEDVYQGFADVQHRAIVDGLELKADCLATLDKLRAQGHYLSIVSNIDEDMLQPLVARASLHDYLDHWTSSEAAGSCKPHETFFAVSLEKSGLNAEQVLFVGDSPEHDVNGASAIGMHTALVRNGGKPAPLQSGKKTAEPDHVIDDLAEIVSILETGGT